MADNKFQVSITANDETSKTLLDISRNLRTLTQGMKSATMAEHKLGSHSIWGMFRERVDGVNEGVGRLGEGLERAHGSLSSLLPPLAALGEIGALGGMFKLTEEVAESFSKLRHDAAKMGFGEATDQLQKFHFIAKMTDTDVGAMDSGFAKFGATLGAAGLGKNKEVVNVFKALGINLRDANGHLKTTAEIMPEIQLAFRNNAGNPSAEGYLARLLFGRGGIELLPMLTQSREELSELSNTFREFVFVPSPAQNLDLERYHRSWVEMGTAVDSLGKQIGADLAPVLEPMEHDFAVFLNEHRVEIAKGISDAIGDMAKSLKNVDWKETFKDFEAFGSGLKEVYDAVGGFKTIFEVFIGWKIVKFSATAVEAFGSITGAVKGVTAAIGDSGIAMDVFNAKTRQNPIFRAASIAFQAYDKSREGIPVEDVPQPDAFALWLNSHVLLPLGVPQGPIWRPAGNLGRRDRDDQTGSLIYPPDAPGATFGPTPTDLPQFRRSGPLDPAGWSAPSRMPQEFKFTFEGLPDGVTVSTEQTAGVSSFTFNLNTGRSFSPMVGAP